MHELVIEAEVHEIPTNHKDVEKLHECMDKTVADRRELLIEQPFNASIEFQSSIVHLIQEVCHFLMHSICLCSLIFCYDQ